MTTTTRNTKPPSTSPVPLAVWPVGQDPMQDQRATHQDPGYSEHQDAIQAMLASRMVEEYSKPRDLVVDLTGGAGTVLVEAAASRRRGIGIWPEDEQAARGRDDLRLALTQRQRVLAGTRTGDIRALPEVLEDVLGAVDLICTSQTSQPGTEAWWPPTAAPSGPSASEELDQDDADQATMAAVYAGCFKVLRPGGLLVVITSAFRRDGELVDVAGATVSHGRRAGFSYFQHVIALRAPIRNGSLGTPPSISGRGFNSRAAGLGGPAHRVVHDDLVVLRKPVETEIAHAN